MRFTNKVALVTGSGRGIGRAIALRLAAEGADLVINYFRNRSPAEDTAREIEKLGRRALVVKAHVGTADGVSSLFQQTEAAFGGLDILVSNAASGVSAPLREQKEKAWDWTMNINARALLRSAQLAAASMERRGGGAIVSLTSQGSYRVLPDYGITGASKAAIEALTRYLAVELAPAGIVVNAVSPGVVETDALEHFAVLRDRDLLPRLAQATPARRLTTAEDVAALVAFLCSAEASMIVGQVIQVDGGFSLPLSWGLEARQENGIR